MLWGGVEQLIMVDRDLSVIILAGLYNWFELFKQKNILYYFEIRKFKNMFKKEPLLILKNSILVILSL